MSRQPILDSLDTVIAQLSDLRLAVATSGGEATADQASSAGSFELVHSPDPLVEPPEPAGGPLQTGTNTTSLTIWSAAWDQAILGATTPEALLALDLTPVRSLEEDCRLKSAGVWTPFGRLCRAFQCGRAALRGLHHRHYQVPTVQTPPVPLRDLVFICLYCPARPQGFWTTTRRSFASLTRDHPGQVVAFGFPSQSEGAAFLLGAEAVWPRREA